MAKKNLFGVNTYHKRTRKKRPGRHKKNRNKHKCFKKKMISIIIVSLNTKTDFQNTINSVISQNEKLQENET